MNPTTVRDAAFPPVLAFKVLLQLPATKVVDS